MEGFWGFVIIGGPIVLFAVLIIARLRSGKHADAIDPDTPSDDPSKGMPGHDRPGDEPRLH